MDNSIVKDWEKYCKEIEGFYEDDKHQKIGQFIILWILLFQDLKNQVCLLPQ